MTDDKPKKLTIGSIEVNGREVKGIDPEPACTFCGTLTYYYGSYYHEKGCVFGPKKRLLGVQADG